MQREIWRIILSQCHFPPDSGQGIDESTVEGIAPLLPAAARVHGPPPPTPGWRWKTGSPVPGRVLLIRLRTRRRPNPAACKRTRTPAPDRLLAPALARSRAPGHVPARALDPGPDANPAAIRTLCVRSGVVRYCNSCSSRANWSCKGHFWGWGFNFLPFFFAQVCSEMRLIPVFCPAADFRISGCLWLINTTLRYHHRLLIRCNPVFLFLIA